MISCYLQGGLGNQLFQIATTLSFSWDNNIKAVFNFNYHHLPLQGNKAISYKDNFYRKLLPINENIKNSFNIYKEPNFYYTPLPTSIKNNNVILHGYFQSEKYFIHNRNKVLEYFSPSREIIKHLKKYEDILNSPNCSVHVRRGDYLKFPNEHPTLEKEYYNSSFKEFDEGTTFLIFSDDIKWCKDNLSYENLLFIENDVDYHNLYLMSLCDHHIIANSSFSWWGAWLNKSTDKRVIAPNKWFGDNKKLVTTDIIPIKWERL